MPWIGGAIAGGASLLGGLMGSSASKKAAESQLQASREAAQAQKEMFEKQIALQEPFRQAGLTAQQRYMNILGLAQAPTARTEAEIRNALAAQYQMPSPGAGQFKLQYVDDSGIPRGVEWVPAEGAGAEQEARLNAAIQAEMAKDAKAAQEYEALKASPEFGKYTRDFGMQDFQQDPGYAFRMSEGLKALDRQAAARGGLISGGALKAAQRYGQEAASQEYTNAFNRYQVNRANQLQPLQSLMGTGQTAANTLTGAAGQYGQGAAEQYIGAGNARASGYMGQANALRGALGQGVNFYQNQQYLNRLQGAPSGGGNPFGGFFSSGAGSMGFGGGSVQGNPDYISDL